MNRVLFPPFQWPKISNTTDTAAVRICSSKYVFLKKFHRFHRKTPMLESQCEKLQTQWQKLQTQWEALKFSEL